MLGRSREEAALISCRHRGMEADLAAAAHVAGRAFFGVEMILTRGTGDDLAAFGHAQSL